MLAKISLVCNTVRHLKSTQIYHQVKYRLRKAGNLSSYKKNYSKDGIVFLSFSKQPPVLESYLGDNGFTFLNLEKKFSSQVDWNFQDYGKLWNYNLQYGNYLFQANISFQERRDLILSMYEWLEDGRLPLEPYPASLRIINAIRFFSDHKRVDEKVLAFVHAELDFLSQRLEFHLLGNHLLENGFTLIMCGAFFSNQHWLLRGQEILEKQLEEQILEDGAHFELSPMYHQIIFFRLLELLDWYANYEKKDSVFEKFLRNKGRVMAMWLEQISFRNGDIPHFNDSAEDIAYPTSWLLSYAASLGIHLERSTLGNSGYRSFSNGLYECKMDFGQVGPSYQPGHAHADTLSFVLCYNNAPLFVEQGTSTYNINDTRRRERSTAAHNTVAVNGENQSEVWSGFRVGKRAKTVITEESENVFIAEHNGYRKLGLNHSRKFSFGDKKLEILDELMGNPEAYKEFHLHIAPGIEIAPQKGGVSIIGTGEIGFEGAESLKVEKYQMADGYNKYKEGSKIIVGFRESLQTTISFKDYM